MTHKHPSILPAGPPDDGPQDPAGPRPSVNFDDGLPLAQPKIWTRGFLIVCAVIAALIFLLVREASTILEMSLSTWIWLSPAAAVILAIIIRRILMPSSSRMVQFGADVVDLPRGRNSRRTRSMAYEDIRTIVPLVSRGQPALVIDGPKGTQIFVASDFPHPELWRVLWAQLTDRIASRPGADEQLQRMRDLANSSQKVSSIGPRFTKRLFWVIAAVFGAQVFLSPPIDVLEFLYFGANSPIMVLQEHQWWRVVTANLLHGNGIHFAVNAFALYFLGTYCERLFGEGRTIVLTLGTAVAGAMASLLGTAALFSVGISTALFGLLGAYFALHLRFGKQLPPPYRQSRRWWIVILGLNAVLSIAVPVIDAWGHFGGFAAGVLLGWLMTWGQDHFRSHRASGVVINLSAAVLVGLFALCSFIAVGYAIGDHPDDEMILATALLERADEDEPAMLAQISHEWSRHTPRPESINPILVGLAESAHERSDDLFIQWRAAAAIITLAEAMGEPFDRGVMQSGVVRFEQASWQHDDASARRVLARLLAQHFNHAGPLYMADAPFDEALFVDEGIALIPGGQLESPRRVYLIAVDETEAERRPEFLLYRCVPAGSPAGTQPRPVDRDVDTRWALEIAMVVAHESCTEEQARLWRSAPVTSPSN